MTYRHIGVVGNRIASVSGVVGDPLTYYVGAAAGGLWKTEDGGMSWRPVFDDQDVHSVGALAVSHSDPQIVWAGTGEPHIRSNVTVGDGVYKSTDGGENWEHMGLDAAGRVSRVVIHPTNPDIVYIGVLGHAHGPQAERGVFRTQDGGQTWEHVLFVDEDTGASSVIMDPNNPRILFAGLWTVVFNVWGRESGGPGSGIYMSRDGGDTWTKLEGHGLPTLPVGKVDVCMSAADSRRVYALIETGDGVPWKGQPTESGELWRSDDGGSEWELINHSRDLGGRTGYYNNCRVTPDDADEVFFLTSGLARSLDGGITYVNHQGRQRPGGDNHDMWMGPDNGDRMMLWASTDNGMTWQQRGEGGRFGHYGEMYPRFLRLRDGRLLLTFTVRSNSTDGYLLGLRAIVSTDDGRTWDFQHDRLILSNINYGASGGGFGNTIQKANGSLVSVYSYRDDAGMTHVEALRWRIPR